MNRNLLGEVIKNGIENYKKKMYIFSYYYQYHNNNIDFHEIAYIEANSLLQAFKKSLLCYDFIYDFLYTYSISKRNTNNFILNELSKGLKINNLEGEIALSNIFLTISQCRIINLENYISKKCVSFYDNIMNIDNEKFFIDLYKELNDYCKLKVIYKSLLS